MKKVIIEKFTKEHAELLGMLSEIEKKATNDNSSDDIIVLLNGFKRKMVSHLEDERNGIYNPIEKGLTASGEFTNEIKMIIDQMEIVASEVFDFLKRYDRIYKTEINEFKKDLDRIIKLLKTRVNLEEKHLFVHWI